MHYYVHYNTIYESFLKNQNVILMNQNYYESLRAEHLWSTFKKTHQPKLLTS